MLFLRHEPGLFQLWEGIPVNQVNTYCPDCQAPLLTAYDLDGVRRDLRREEFAVRGRG